MYLVPLIALHHYKVRPIKDDNSPRVFNNGSSDRLAHGLRACVCWRFEKIKDTNSRHFPATRELSALLVEGRRAPPFDEAIRPIFKKEDKP